MRWSEIRVSAFLPSSIISTVYPSISRPFLIASASFASSYTNTSTPTPTIIPYLPFYDAISQGLIPGYSEFKKEGYMPISVLGSYDYETQWAPGGTYVFPVTAQSMSVSSSSVSDTSAGVGIRTLFIMYLDGSWNSQALTVTMNGTTPVTVGAGAIFRIKNMSAITTGSVGEAVGNIVITSLGGAVTYGEILAQLTKDESGFSSVANGTTLHITNITYTSASDSANIGTLRMRIDSTYSGNGPVTTVGQYFPYAVSSLSGGAIPIPMDSPLIFPQKTDWKITVKGSANTESNTLIQGYVTTP